jgi:hypothetical protein
MDDYNTSFVITAIEGESADLTKVPTAVEYSVKMGKKATGNNYDLLRGKEISVSSVLAVSNLKSTKSATSKTQIADAELSVTKDVKDLEITTGDTDEYTITVVNDKDDNYSSNSVARNVVIEDDLDEAAAEFGYKIDRDTLKVMLDDEDITEESDVYVLWEDGDTGFDLTLSSDLAKEQTLTITYEATTVDIDAASYTETLGNVVFASADNSKPAVDYKSVTYIGVDLPSDDPETEAAEDGENADSANGISQTGDIIPYVIGGVIAVAVISGAIVLVVRRRSR